MVAVNRRRFLKPSVASVASLSALTYSRAAGAPNDKVVPCSAGRELARLLPNARLLLARVGHAALIHPRIDLARLLADPAHWPGLSAADSSATRAADRSG